MADNLIEQFQEAFWKLRLSRVSGWERIIAEEILLRTWGRNRPHLHIRTLDLIAGVWGLSKGNVHGHLDALVKLGIVENDARAAMAARLGKDWQKSSAARPDRDARIWWINELSLWVVRLRVEPDSPAGVRSAVCDAALRDDNPELPGQVHLPGFEEQTGGEVQADAALARAESIPTAGPSAAASPSASHLFPRSTFWNQTGQANAVFVPESGTNVPETGTNVPETGTKPGSPSSNARARPGSLEQNSQASQAPRGGPGQPGTEGPKSQRVYRPLTAAEYSLLDEIEAWSLEGGDDPALTAEYRPKWEARIRGYQGVVERAFRDVQLGVREGRDVVKKARGGLLKCRFEEFLRRQPPKMHGSVRAARPASRPAVATAPITPPPTPEEVERNAEACRRHMAEFRERMGRGTS